MIILVQELHVLTDIAGNPCGWLQSLVLLARNSPRGLVPYNQNMYRSRC